MSAGHVLMATFLTKAMKAAGLDVDRLAYELNYRSRIIPQSWLDGRDLPALDRIERLADVAQVDRRELAVGWLMEKQPRLAGDLRTLLDEAGLYFPSHGDADLVTLRSRPRGAVLPPPARLRGMEPPPRPAAAEDQ